MANFCACAYYLISITATVNYSFYDCDGVETVIEGYDGFVSGVTACLNNPPISQEGVSVTYQGEVCSCEVLYVECTEGFHEFSVSYDTIFNGKPSYYLFGYGNIHRAYWDGTQWVIVILPTNDILFTSSVEQYLCSLDTLDWTPVLFDEYYTCFGDYELIGFFEAKFCTSSISSLTGDTCNCWSITSYLGEPKTVIYYDCYDNLKLLEIPSFETDITVEFCIKGTPYCLINGVPQEDCGIMTENSCDTYCSSGTSCGDCINISYTCVQEIGNITIILNNIQVSGIYNNRPYYLFFIGTSQVSLSYFGNRWTLYSFLQQDIIGVSEITDAECPFDLNWFELSSSIFCGFGASISGSTFTIVPSNNCLPPVPPTPTPTPVFECPTNNGYVNECNVLTLFQMGVQCSVTNPTNYNSANGSTSLIITGGTPPYTTVWSNGNVGQSITNLSSGSYTAITTDYYGDFIVQTVCTLSGPTPTPSPTQPPTPTPTPIPYDLCMRVEFYYKEEFSVYVEHFNPNGIQNGQESWISDDMQQEIIWNSSLSQWEVVSVTPIPTIINSNPSYPPLTGWVILGYPGNVQVIQGSCEGFNELQ